MKIQKVSYGTNFKHKINPIGFGAMRISEFYSEIDEISAHNTIKIALALGINHFDTADYYAFGDNEVFLGKSLNLSNYETRKKLIIASKAGILMDRDDKNIRGICIIPEYLKGQLERSLKNLGTNYLDIFYIHRLPPEASDHELEVLAKFLQEIAKDGLINSVGLSEPNLQQLEKIHTSCPIGFVQSEYSLLERGVEQNGVLDFCKKENIIFVAYSPLCRGLLTEQFNINNLDDGDFRIALPKFSGDNYTNNINVINKLREFANARNISLSCLALSWLKAQNILVIPGMRKPEQVLDALMTLQFELTNDDLVAIDEIAYLGAIKGTRYAESAMKAYGFK